MPGSYLSHEVEQVVLLKAGALAPAADADNGFDALVEEGLQELIKRVAVGRWGRRVCVSKANSYTHTKLTSGLF